MSDRLQVWASTIDGARHRVEVRGGAVRRYTQWSVDGERVAAKGSAESRLRLTADGHGTLVVRHSPLGAPLRATLQREDGDVDLEPEPGSPAARHEERLRAHPRRYTLLQTTGGAARVVVPLVLGVLLTRLALSIDWPSWDLPDLPAPDLPDLPGLPLPDVTLPGWLRWLLQHAKYVLPILLAFGLARAEVRRRRRQDALRDGPGGERG